MATNRDSKATQKGLLGCIGVVAMIGALGWLYVRRLNQLPTIHIPPVTMPSPNARDYYIKAGSLLQESKAFNEALAAMRKRQKGQAATVPPLSERLRLIKVNQPVVDTLHKGFAYEYREVTTRSFYDPFRHYSSYRDMARFLAMAGRTYAEQKNWNAAMQCYLDTLQLGIDTPKGAPLIGDLVGAAITAIAHASLEDVVPYLDAKAARAATKRLETILARQTSFAEILEEEKWIGLASLTAMFHKSSSREEGFESLLAGEDTPLWIRLRMKAQFAFLNKGKVLRDYERYMNVLIANARTPLAMHLPAPPLPSDPINQILLEIFTNTRPKHEESMRKNIQLLVRLAIRAYQAEHGTHPDTLQALVPDYLPRLPDDPMAMGGTFGYRKQKEGYLLFTQAGMPSSAPASP